MNKKQLLNSLKNQGFSDKIVKAFEKIRREDFVPSSLKDYSYQDEPLPIGQGQTISQPYTIAFMLNLLELGDNLNILEVGSGSGYVLALISEISQKSRIFGVERIKELYERSKGVLKNKKNIKFFFGDGTKGLKEKAPFDRVLVSASANDIPKKLVEQLNYGGILVVPVKNSIISLKKEYRENKIHEYPGFVFVPLVEEKK